jgi:hypothetical protein
MRDGEWIQGEGECGYGAREFILICILKEIPVYQPEAPQGNV